MTRPLLTLLVLGALGACRTDPPSEEPAPPPLPSPADTSRPAPPTPFDAADTAFSPTEPPEQTVRFPPRPPRPSPPRPEPPPPGPAGSCDVRASEGYCFTYTGDGWTPASAREQCAGAPEAAFGAAACPTVGRIATCTYERASAPGREIVYTYYAPYDPALAELACPGTFARVDGSRP